MVLVGIAFLVSRTASLTREVKVLKDILPICSYCKKIRDTDGSWKQMDDYVSEHTTTKFSHGLCEECANRLYPNYFKK